MIYFRQTIITRIKSASDKQGVEIVIQDSIQRLKKKNVNGHIIQRFIVGMGLALHRERTEQHSVKTQENISNAIELFQKFNKPLA